MLPRVSDILKILYPTALDFVSNEALTTGLLSHLYMEMWVKSKIEKVGPPSLDKLLEGKGEQKRILALLEWFKVQHPEFMAAEKLYIAKDFCGHPDLVAGWKNKLWVFDYKFSESITEQNLVQGEAYRHLVPNCYGVALIQVPKNGIIKVHKLKNRPDLWAIFLNGLNVWQWRNRNGN